ncbi:MAG: PIG-L family deacetylase [Planctomycetota bacterium]|nr:MAG: PIG-L family deacetylase [Planctomycetota bacterium]
MGRLLPCPLRRPLNVFSMPHVGDRLPGERVGFAGGDPQEWVPGLLHRLQVGGRPAQPWSAQADLLLHPYPRPNQELAELDARLADLPANFPVALYEAETPILPNLLMAVPEDLEGGEPGGSSPGAGLRRYRSAFRHQGQGQVEALVLLPAQRLRYLLRGSFLCEVRPGPGASLQNRRFLIAALDHQRSLMQLCGGDFSVRIGLPEAKRVVVIMPHFDDDVLQCGGAMAQARQQGAEVRMIWLTDGALGVSTVSPEESTRIRKQEAANAMAMLGIEDFHFLDAPETRLKARGPWTRRLKALLQEFQPDRVHAVWWADNNVDHFEANRVLRAAWPVSLNSTSLAASGIWTPVPGNRYLPLSPADRQLKDEVTRAYASQIAEVDYLQVERGLSLYHAGQARQVAGLEVQSAESYLLFEGGEYWRRFRTSGVPKRWLLG